MEGKVVVITGASSALGEATARFLSAKGATGTSGYWTTAKAGMCFNQEGKAVPLRRVVRYLKGTLAQ